MQTDNVLLQNQSNHSFYRQAGVHTNFLLLTLCPFWCRNITANTILQLLTAFTVAVTLITAGLSIICLIVGTPGKHSSVWPAFLQEPTIRDKNSKIINLKLFRIRIFIMTLQTWRTLHQ
jgi:hypothetical protein